MEKESDHMKVKISPTVEGPKPPKPAKMAQTCLHAFVASLTAVGICVAFLMATAGEGKWAILEPVLGLCFVLAIFSGVVYLLSLFIEMCKANKEAIYAILAILALALILWAVKVTSAG